MFSRLLRPLARLAAAALGCLAAVGLLGCGGGGGGEGTPPPSPAVSLTLSGSSVQVRPGQSASLEVTLQRSGGFAGAVRLSADGLPASVSMAVTPAGDVSGNSATLAFTATGSAQATTTTVLVRAVATSGSPSGSAAFTLQVLPPPQGFQVGVAASTLLLARPLPGETAARVSAPVPLTLTRTGGYVGSPTWTLEGLPAGVSAAFQPAATGEPASFTLAVAPSSSPGTTQIQVKATDGALVSTASLAITVSGGNDYEYKPEVMDLSGGAVTVLAVGSDTVTLQGTVASVQPGKVLIHNAADDKRFLRKVASVSSAGGNTVLATTEATVQDVFARAAILKNEIIPPSALAGIQGVDSTVTFGAPQPVLVPSRGTIEQAIPCTISGFQIKSDSGQVLAELRGEIFLVLGIEGVYITDWKGIPSEARIAPFLNVAGNLELSGHVGASFDYEAPLSVPFKFPTPFNVGGLGVNGELSLSLRVNGTLSGDGRVTVAGYLNAKNGVQYSFGVFSAVNEWSKDFGIKAAEVRASCSLGVSLVRPNLGLDVLGIGQVYLASDLVRAELEIAYQTGPPSGFQISTFGDFNVGIGGRLKLGPFTLWDDRFDLDIPHWPSGTPVFLPELTPASTRIAWLGVDGHTLWTMYGDGSEVTAVFTDPGATLYAPSLSQDGRAIVFGRINPSSGKGEVCTIGADGSGYATRTGSAYSINHPAWGPNGVILFDSSDSSNLKQLYALKLSDNSVTQLTTGPSANRHPNWSPDGTYLIFERRETSGAKSRIARMEFANPAAITYLSDDGLDYFDPSYSANGRRIAYRDSFFIRVMDDLGYPTAVFGPPSGSFFKHPWFSPDGTMLILDDNPITAPTIRIYSSDGGYVYGLWKWGTYPTWREIK